MKTDPDSSHVVEIISDIDRLHEIKSEWEQLVDRTDGQTIYVEPSLVLTWLRCFAADATLHCIAVWRNQSLVGLLPLVAASRRYVGLTFRVLEYPMNGVVSRFYPLLAADEPGVMQSLAAAIVQSLESFDFVCLVDSPDDNEVVASLRNAIRERGVGHRRRAGKRSPFVRIRSGYSEYLGSRSAGFREKLRRSRRKLARTAELSVEHVLSPSRNELTSAFLVSDRSWKQEKGTAMARSEAWRNYFVGLTDLSTERVRVLFSFLKLDQEPVAFALSIGSKRRMECLRTDYDQKYSALSPGFDLLSEVIAWCHQDGCSEYDLAGRSYSYKLRFADSARSHSTDWIFGRRRRARLLQILVQSRDLLRGSREH